jgi:serine/threonine-protein kinase
VYAAEDVRIGAAVTIEVLREGLGNGSLPARAFHRRAKLSCRVHHPNVLSPHDIGKLDDDSAFVVTKRIEGDLLEERIVLGGPISAPEVVRMGLQVLAGVGAAHASGVVHGALGPDVIAVVQHRGEIVSAHVSGFGAKRSIDDETVLGYLLLAFTAPEVVAGGEPTVASDIYAIGAILYLAATSFAPSASEVGDGVGDGEEDGTLQAETMLQPDLPLPLLRVLVRALASAPADRYASVDEMLRELAEVAVRPRLAVVAVEERHVRVPVANETRSRAEPTITEHADHAGRPTTRRGIGPQPKLEDLPSMGTGESGIVLRGEDMPATRRADVVPIRRKIA